MTVPFSQVKRLLRAQRMENLRYEAFVKGYAHGRQDQEAGKRIDGPDELRRRTEDLFEQVTQEMEAPDV